KSVHMRCRSSLGAGDEPRAALKGEIGPKPVDGDDQAVANADEKIDVDEAPDPPGEPAGKPEEAEIDHRRAPTDGREVADVDIAEGRRRAPASEPRADDPGGVFALLLGDRGHAGQRRAVAAEGEGGVAEGED